MLRIPAVVVRCIALFLFAGCAEESPAPDAAAAGANAAEPGGRQDPPPTVEPPAAAFAWDEVLEPYGAVLDREMAAELPGIDWQAAVAAASSESGNVERRAAGFYVLGCKLTLDFGSVKSCLEGKIDKLEKEVERKVKDAQKAAENEFKQQLAAAQQQAAGKLQQASALASSYQKQVAGLQQQVAGLQAELARGVAQAKAQAEAAARNQLQGLQQKLDAELRRSADLSRTIDQLRREVQQAANAVTIQVEWQKALFAGLAQLRLDGLFGCLQREAFTGRADFAAAVQQFAADPLAFTQATIRDLASKLGRQFGALIQDELTDLATGKPAPSDRELVRRAFDKLAIVAEDTGPGKCVFAHARPQLEKSAVTMAQTARQIATQMQREAEKTLREKILPTLLTSVTSTLEQTLAAQLARVGLPATGVPDVLPPQITDLLLTEEEMKRVAQEVLFRRNIRERFATADVNLAALLDPQTAKEAVGQHVADLKKLVQGTQDYEALYLEIGVEMLRSVGHKYVRSKTVGHGGYLVDQAMGLLQITEGTVEKVAEAVCGLIPEAGAAVCAVVVEIIDVVYQQGIPLLSATATKLMNGAVDELGDRLKEQLLSKQTLATIRKNSGPLGDVLRALPHEQAIGLWAGAILKDEMALINKHFDRVAALAEKVAK